MMQQNAELQPRRYVDPEAGVTVVRVNLGEHHTTAVAGEVLTAHVGRAVAVCLRDAKKQVGGLLVMRLPPIVDEEATRGLIHRYGAYAIEEVIVNLEKRGGRK
ncbi:MAG: hypothetical protein ACPGYL_13620, partial [Rhodospirillaceae bacterium]